MTVFNKIALIALLAVSISSCSPKSGGPAPASVADANRDFSNTSFAVSGPDIPSDYANCSFNGQTVLHGSSVTGYQNSTVLYGSTCISQIRRCNDGVLAGSYQYASCTVAGPASCLFNGQTIAHGSSVEAFQNSTVAFGSSCVSEQRTCNNGSLSGSNSYGSCSVDTAASCLFNGQTVAHGSNVSAFANSTVAYGETCTAETRSCNNGVLSGSSAYASCNIDAAASCLFNGQTVAHGSQVNGFANSSVPYGQTCTAESRICDNGVLSGSSAYASCNVDVPQSCLFNGETIAHGQLITAFQNSTAAFGGSCVSEQRSCENGVMSGSYQYGSCNVDAAKSCLFNGQTVAHGQSVEAFPSSTVNFGDMCISDTRTCDNGILSGSNQYASCSATQAASCLFNGQTIAHNQTIQAFATSTVGFGESCVAEERSCFNGVLDGSSQYASCTVAQPASCLINGLTIAHGQSTILFKESNVAIGQTCESESRTCANGTLSGSYTSGSCEVEQAKTCSFNGQTLANGETVQAYASASVGYDQSCKVETRTCSNGVLSGANTYSSCSVESAKSCSFNGATVPHGGSTQAWATNSVAYGQSCKSEIRSCTNGVLSGSNTYSSCSVEPAKSCTFNGQVVANGASVQAYSSSQVPYGQTCQSETRTCSNGVLSGSNTIASCAIGPKPPVVTPPKSCTFNGKTIASGASVQAFKSSSVSYGQSCQSETRTCNDGVLSGSNPAATCVVDGPKSCKILFGLITIPHGFTLWAAAHTTAGAGSRCEAEITLCNNGKFVIDPSLTCQHGTKPPVTIPPPKPGEPQCEIDTKTNNGKHLGVDHDGKHVDSGLHLGWYKGDKPCKPKDPVKPPVPPKPEPQHPCEHKDDPKKPCAHKKDPKRPCDHKEEPKKKPCDHNDKHKSSKDKDDCDKKRKK